MNTFRFIAPFIYHFISAILFLLQRNLVKNQIFKIMKIWNKFYENRFEKYLSTITPHFTFSKYFFRSLHIYKSIVHSWKNEIQRNLLSSKQNIYSSYQTDLLLHQNVFISFLRSIIRLRQISNLNLNSSTVFRFASICFFRTKMILMLYLNISIIIFIYK